MSRKFSFRSGIHLPCSKERTEALPIETLCPPEKLIIPLSQHVGSPAKLLVKRGDDVRIGQMLGEAGGFVSAPVHASVSGKISAIADFPHPGGKRMMAVEIENNGRDDAIEFKPLGRDWREAAPGEIIRKISACGVVGMGGASFPTHVKLSPPSEKEIDTLIINGVECEPYLTADHRLLLEKTTQILFGAAILRKTLGARQTFIAVEDNKQDAIEAIRNSIAEKDLSDLTPAVLKTKYPQGGEKQLINAITGREVPSGGLPMDCGCVVQNVATTFAVWDAVCNGVPLYQRVVTVTGATVAEPRNLLIRVGTPFRYVLEHCKTDMSRTEKVIVGGPMMGVAQADLDAPVLKATSGLLVRDDVMPGVADYNCINCSNCVKACPTHLVPSAIAKYVGKEMYDEAEAWNVLDCTECGSCAYVCPSKINLVHLIKLGKYHVMNARKATGE